MGLAAPKAKQRFGLDPRNTNWANDTSRFGHKHLSKLGWKQGAGLGSVPHAVTTHIKVSFKEDTVGLGAQLAKKNKKIDEFDSGECTGLDVFQRLLGRLNGKEVEIKSELERQREERIISGKWGIAFVRGDTLRSTWDKEAKSLKSAEGESTDKLKKRKREDDDVEIKDKKKSKKEKKEKKEKKSKDKKEKKEKKSKDKKQKSEKKEKKEKKEGKEKKEKKEKKHKKDKKDKKEKKNKNIEVTRESMLKPIESRENTPPVTNGRLALRSKWIKQKRAAVMDSKALNEIFMIQ
ncbi:hypothetical protein B5S28_g1845 [[Candida] boidinii]|nr:hypothetical protein B5S28_g1845 [[Candida] boidinii]OWB59667.1 hypothetical protein B5S29_g528 [[Candida] boidinii]OWB71514.1 hypothetical protein B5S31_g1203 [[Candida] boidinii]OWB76514.1 hypothetical protein B5S32_g666 [[Candida] boidinii]